MMSSSFSLGERNSTLSSEGISHEASQSGHEGDSGINTSASHREVELVPVTDWPQSMGARARYVQYNKATQLH